MAPVAGCHKFAFFCQKKTLTRTLPPSWARDTERESGTVVALLCHQLSVRPRQASNDTQGAMSHWQTEGSFHTTTTRASEFEKSEKRKHKCISEDEEVTATKPYKCRFCHMKFDKSQALGGHMNRHRQEREREQLLQARQLVMQQEFPSFVSPGQCNQYSSLHLNQLQAPSTLSPAYNAKTMIPPGAFMLQGIPYGTQTSPLLASSGLCWNLQPSLRSLQNVATTIPNKTRMDLESSPQLLQSKIFDTSSNPAMPFNMHRENNVLSRMPAEGAKKGFGSPFIGESSPDTHETDTGKSSKRRTSAVTLNRLDSNSSVLTSVGSQHEAHYAPPFAASRVLQPAGSEHTNLDSLATAPLIFNTYKMDNNPAVVSNEACGNHFEGLPWMFENDKDTGYGGHVQPDSDTNLSDAVMAESGQSGIVTEELSLWDSARHSTGELSTQATATPSHSLPFAFDYQSSGGESDRKSDP